MDHDITQLDHPALGVPNSDAITHLDVLIVGAGISGIAAAYHLQQQCPQKSFAILEARDALGGTWDFFKYPGLRSDSDLYTFGFSFRPWTSDKSIADAATILKYLRETAAAFGIDKTIRYGQRVIDASWDSDTALWSVTVTHGDRQIRYSCHYLYMCSGYYNYAKGYTPQFANEADFKGLIVHPQNWPESLDTSGKRIVVIGSGATAVTLVPELAKTAAHVTMLQRSPTYIVARPARDPIATWLRDRLPATAAHRLTRWKNVLLGLAFYKFARGYPDKMAGLIRKGVQHQLGDQYDIATHFTPRYKPWDQRLCLVPDGDLFKALRDKTASIVTDGITHFDETGIALASGAHLDADIIVTATGLDLVMLSGIPVSVDGERVDVAKQLIYKGMMLSGIPNFAFSVGYTNASWTLKCELTAKYVCRLLNRMDRRQEAYCYPERDLDKDAVEPALDFTSGYVQRAADVLPKQGTKTPWKLHQNYARDLFNLSFGRLDDSAMRFVKRAAIRKAA
jgi:cation diffusion facilitator CzcD-associated flavoprotein CzcO